MRSGSRPDLQLFLNRILSRSESTGDEQEAILDLPGQFVEVKANRDFVGLREDIEHASLIVDGLVGRFDQNSKGLRQITAIHIPGDMANLHSVVQPQATSALQALSVATIFRVPHDAIRIATVRLPGIAEALWRDCMVDNAVLSKWVVNVGRSDARSRLAHILCEMATRLKAPTEAGVFAFSFAVTQFQLADAAGLTGVHVNRVLRSLREQNLADVRGREVKVLDWRGLTKAGDFDGRYLQADTATKARLRVLQGAALPGAEVL